MVGLLELTFEGMALVADPELTMFVFTAEVGSKSEEALNLLASWTATLDEPVSTNWSGDVPIRSRPAFYPRVANIEIQPEPVISWDTSPAVALTFLVNFGIFAGRDVSKLELARLGHLLLRVVDGVTLVSEHRFELAEGSSIDLHQVRVAIDRDVLPSDEPDIEALRVRIAGLLDDWMRSCLTEVSGQEFTDAELDARDAVVEGVLDMLPAQRS